MWLVTTLAAATAATLIWRLCPPRLRQEYRLSCLGLMLWGAASMMLVDHVLGYEGGEFLELTTSGLIENGVALGLVMLVPVFCVWGAMLLTAGQGERRRTASQRI